MKKIYILFCIFFIAYTHLQAQTNNLGNAIFQEDFGTIPPVSEWQNENGDNTIYNDPKTYRKRDSRSSYTFLSYARRADIKSFSLNSSKPADKPTGAVGEWSFGGNYTKPLFSTPQPFDKTHINNPQFVWCREVKGLSTSYTLTDDSYTDGKEFSPCEGGESVRWIYDGKWKLGYWSITSRTERGNWLEAGKYAVGANFYQIGEDDWENVAADRNGDPEGLALMVHAPEAGGNFYTLPLNSLIPGVPYHFSLFVKNPDQQAQYGGIFGILASDKAVPNLTVTVQNTSYSGTSGDLPFADPSWKEVAFDFTLPAGQTTATLIFSMAKRSNNTDHRGNGIGIDDISVKPYIFSPGNFTADVCSSYGTVTLTSTPQSLRANTPVYTRWARRDKNTGTWDWWDAAGTIQTRNQTVDEYKNYDYRVVHSYSESLLNNLPANQSEASFNSDYQYSQTLNGVELPVFENSKMDNFCIAGASLDNRYEVALKLKGAISSFSYKIGDDGEEVPVLSPSEGEFILPEFTAPANTNIYITKCEYQGCEASAIASYQLPYKDKAIVSGIPAKTALFEGDELALTGTEISTFPDASFKWYDSEDFSGTPIGTGLTYSSHSLATGSHTFYLAEENPHRCLSTTKAEVMIFPLSQVNDPDNKILKLSEIFSVSLSGIKNISQYSLVLKSSSAPAFSFSPQTGTIENNENGNARIDFVQGNSALLASADMAGHHYTFLLTLWEEYNYNNQIYSRPIEKEITYTIIAEPGIYLPALTISCPGDNLTLKPVIGGNPDIITNYQWYMDGRPVSTDPVLSLVNLTQAHNDKTISLKISYPGGESSSNTTTISVFDNSGNLIDTQEPIVLLRQRISLRGSLSTTKGVSYQWQQHVSGKDWEDVSGADSPSLDITLLQTTKFRRVISAGQCQSVSNEIFVEAFDNDQNRINYDENTQVIAQTSVTVEGTALNYETAPSYQWQQKQADGTWTDIAGANEPSLRFAPEITTIVRRLVSAGNCKDNISNLRIVSVYNPGQENAIYCKNTYGLPGSEMNLTGTEPARPGFTFQWLQKHTEASPWQTITEATNRNLTYKLTATTLFARVMLSQDDAGNPVQDTSNIIRVILFDNSTNVISGASSLCKYNETDISGSKPDYAGLTYQWQSSQDGEVWDYTGVSTQNLRTNISATTWFRRIVNLDNLPGNISNSIQITAVDYAHDNILPDAPVLAPESDYTIEGLTIPGVTYQWQNSEDGTTWTDLAGSNTPSLNIRTNNSESISYYRRKIVTTSGCEDVNPWSNSVKITVAILPEINIIEAPAFPLCPGSAFTITGNSREDATYAWKSSIDGETWMPVALANTEHLTVEGGVNQPTLYRREVILNNTLYRSNIAVIQVYDLNKIHNQIINPPSICQGETFRAGVSSSEIPAVELYPLPGNFPTPPAVAHSAIHSVHWEKSITGATGSWASISEGTSLQQDSVTDTYKYRRIIILINGLSHISNEIAPEVYEKPRLAIYTNVPLDKLNVSAPIRINVTPDYLRSYEFIVNHQTQRQTSAVLESYNWIPNTQNTITVNALTEAGCSTTNTISFKGPDVDLPNVITCNADGKNDLLLPGYELIVFNRLGSTVFQGTQGWDGKFRGNLVSPGTYFYKVKIRMPDGKIREFQNNVLVINK